MKNFKEKDQEETKEILTGINDFLETNFKRDKRFINRYQLHKITWIVAEELDLDITRAWYKRGQYVFNATPLINRAIDNGFNEIKKGGELTNKTIEVLENKKDTIRDLIKTSFFEFTEITYSRLTDKRIQPIYKAHNPIFVYMHRLLDSEDMEELKETINKLGLEENINQKITEIHTEIITKEEFKELRDPYIDLTEIIENLFLSLKHLSEKNKLTKKQMKASKRIFSHFFDQKNQLDQNDAWGYIAWIISGKTAKGRDSKKIKNISKKYQEEAEEAIKEITEKTKQLMKKHGLEPTEEMLEKSLEKTKIPNKDEEKIKDFLNTYSGVKERLS
ncbi:hypothetical protein C9439_03915 [archaeon SCG-AAA382B04]|nr:hypothetical protein C9439_03915 [archaeon SCG-AAA382B04]